MDAPERFPALDLSEGGPGAAVLRRLQLASPLGAGSARAAAVIAAVAWVPLLLLSASQGLLLHGATIPFLYDVAAHVRFLVAVPILLLAEIPIGARLRLVVRHFLEAGLVRPEDHERFAEIIADSVRFRDSRVAELTVLAAAYVSTYALLTASFQAGSTWHAPGPAPGPSHAGYWYALVAVPIFQFLIYRWIYRMIVWARFLRKVAGLDLALTATHPDGAGGLGFVGQGCIPFGVLLFAASAVVSGAIASRVLFGGAKLETFQLPYAALFVLALAVFAGPLFVFVPSLLRLKQRALLEYGTLASRYTQGFDRKWSPGGDGTDEELLGTGDIQSLADLGSGYERVRKMRPLPIELADFVAMAIPGVLPALPLALTVMPVSDILKSLLHLLA